MSTSTVDRNPKELVLLAKAGDSEAFSLLYDLYFMPLYRYVYFRVPSKEEAEDMVQTVFLKAYEHLGRYEDRGKDPLAFFYTIARNSVLDFFRKKRELLPDRPEAIQEYAEQSKEGTSAGQGAFDREHRETLETALKVLSDDQRDAIVLKYLNDWLNADIADFLGKSEEAVRQLQSRGLKILREHVKI